MRRLGNLWHGRLPLGDAFWIYGILIGAMVNIAATGASLAALAAGLNGVAALVIHLSPLPYNAAMVVGVWRSAARHDGPRYHGQAAQIAVLAWAALLTVL